MKSFRKEDVVGKTVIETSGAVRGKVEDVVFDLSGAVTFVVKGADNKESQVALASVTGISEHIVVKSDSGGETSGSAMGTSCKFCGAAKAPSERWCPRCGKAQV